MKNAAEIICEIGKRLYEKGLVVSHDGNISARLDDGLIIVTPTLTNKGRMKETDMVIVDLAGNVIKGSAKPSSELKMHLEVYKRRADIRGVVHAHPVYACVFAVLGRAVDMKYMPEAIKTLGSIPVAKYAEPGTQGIPDSIAPFVQDHNGALLANHGAITWAKDLEWAYNLMEQLEFYCQVSYLAEKMGKPNIIG